MLRRGLLGCLGTVLVSTTWVACVGDDPPLKATSDASVDDSGGGVDSSSGNDSGNVSDGAITDTGSGGDASGTTCDTMFPNATFCDDFDTGALKPGWGQLGNGGNIIMTPNFSAPYALRTNTPDAQVAVQSRVERNRTPAQGATSWTLDARVRVGAAQANPDGGNPFQSPILMQIQFDQNSSLLFQMRAPSPQFSVCSGVGTTLGQDMIFGHQVWHHVRLRVTKGDAGDIELFCDVDGNSRSANVAATVGNVVSYRLGVYAFAGQGALDVAYDDVVFNER